MSEATKVYTWEDIDAFMQKWGKYKLSFRCEYSNVIDWVVDFTPKRWVKHAADYDYWGVWSTNRNEAIKGAMEKVEEALLDAEKEKRNE